MIPLLPAMVVEFSINLDSFFSKKSPILPEKFPICKFCCNICRNFAAVLLLDRRLRLLDRRINLFKPRINRDSLGSHRRIFD